MIATASSIYVNGLGVVFRRLYLISWMGERKQKRQCAETLLLLTIKC
jgi:hypothetical protein